MITLLDRYLIRRLIIISLFAVLVFTMAWLAPEIMFKAIQGVANHQLTPLQGIAYLIYQIPEVLTYCLPISMLFGTVFLFRQLSLSSELIAIFVSGISFRRVMLPIVVVGFVFSLLFFFTQEVLAPVAAVKLRELSQATHFDEEENVQPSQVTFVERRADGSMDKFLVISPSSTAAQNKFIFLFYTGTGDSTFIARIMTASTGTWNTQHGLWKLKDGISYELNPDGVYREVRSFEEMEVKTNPIPHALLSFPTGNPAEFSLGQLSRYVRLLTRGEQTEDARFYMVRLLQRCFLPWIPLIFSMLGMGLGIERSRATRNLGLTYAAVLLLIYNISVPSTTTLGSIGVMPAYMAAILPLLIATGMGLIIIRIRKSEG